MQPETPRDFLKVAAQRLAAAESISKLTGLNLEAQYIAGYAVECAFKALILETTTVVPRPEMLERITHGAKYHRVDTLIGILRDQKILLTLELVKRMKRFDWDVNLRYETGRRDASETNAMMRTARMILDWAKDQIP